ncbi:MAG: cytochrome c biogenesis protein ResB, partial [Bdellovibrionales bacterium]
IVIGSVMTQKLGLDGSVSIPVGGSSKFASVSEKIFSVYATHDGDSYSAIHSEVVDFIGTPPDKKAYKFKMPDGEIEIIEYHPFAVERRRIVASDSELDKPAIRFLLKNPQANFSDWMAIRAKDTEKDLGPVKIIFAENRPKSVDVVKNTLLIYYEGDKTKYEIYKKESQEIYSKGELSLGEPVMTPWMGMTLSLLANYKHAMSRTEFTPKEYPSGITREAVKLRYRGKEHWMGINGVLKFYGDNSAYIINWGNKQVDLGFAVKLEEFMMEKYPGTQRAASYASRVSVPDTGEIVISMNEPLKYKGFTFYQASFQRDDDGKPTTSILSVNHDPGRFWKYLGSALVTLGSILLFYFRHYYIKPKKVEK